MTERSTFMVNFENVIASYRWKRHKELSVNELSLGNNFDTELSIFMHP